MKLPDNFNIAYYAARYSDDDSSIERIVPQVKARGYLTKSDVLAVSEWNAYQRIQHHIKENSDNYIEKITRAALQPDTPECDRINGLRRMRGVDWAMASAILHWFHADPYPIWAKNVLETVIQFEKSQYKNDLERWQAYVSFCRNVAAQNGVDIRTLDRALWQYSKDRSNRV